MKIISKWKDYYDYLQGKYGIDDLIVYDRRGDEFIKHNFDTDHMVKSLEFHICNRVYTVHEYKGEFYHFYEDILRLDKILEEDYKRTLLTYWSGKPSRWSNEENYNQKYNGVSTLNIQHRKPVLLKTYYGLKLPLLSSYNFHKIIPPEDMFNQVYSFISWLKDNPEIPNKQSDLEKLLSHGFDKKKSFRHRK